MYVCIDLAIRCPHSHHKITHVQASWSMRQKVGASIRGPKGLYLIIVTTSTGKISETENQFGRPYYGIKYNVQKVPAIG